MNCQQSRRVIADEIDIPNDEEEISLEELGIIDVEEDLLELVIIIIINKFEFVILVLYIFKCGVPCWFQRKHGPTKPPRA